MITKDPANVTRWLWASGRRISLHSLLILPGNIYRSTLRFEYSVPNDNIHIDGVGLRSLTQHSWMAGTGDAYLCVLMPGTDPQGWYWECTLKTSRWAPILVVNPWGPSATRASVEMDLPLCSSGKKIKLTILIRKCWMHEGENVGPRSMYNEVPKLGGRQWQCQGRLNWLYWAGGGGTWAVSVPTSQHR